MNKKFGTEIASWWVAFFVKLFGRKVVLEREGYTLTVRIWMGKPYVISATATGA